MRITKKSFIQRVANVGFAFVIALSTVTASSSFLFSEKAEALANREYALDLDDVSANVRANTSDTDTLLATAESRTWLIGWTGWSDFYALLGSATLKATVIGGGEVSLDGTSWSDSKTQTIGQFGKVQKNFVFRANAVGTHAINFQATIPTTEGVRTVATSATLNATPINFTAPQPTAPQNGGTVHGDNTTFGWNGVADAQQYEVRVSKSPSRVGTGNDGELNGSDAETLAPVAATSLNKTLSSYGTWFWQVRAKAGAQVGPWSNIWSTKLNAVPQSAIVTPAAGGFVATKINTINAINNSLRVTGTFTDDVAPNYLQLELVRAGNLVTVFTLHGSNPVVAANGDFNLNMAVPNLTDGEYSLFYTPTDFDGAVGPRTERVFNVDNTKPVVSISSESTLNPASLTINATDAGSGVNRVTGNVYKLNTAMGTYELHASNSSLTQNQFTVNLSTLSGGEYYVRYNAVDKVGNLSVTNQFAFSVDRTPPTITVKDNYVGSLSAKTFSNVSFKLYDAKKVDYYSINGTVVPLTDNEWSDANFADFKSKLTQDENTFVLYDVAGNSSSYVFTYDSSAPVVDLEDITPVTVGADVVVNGTVADPSISTVQVVVDGIVAGSATVVSGEFSFDLSGLTVGSHDIKVEAMDLAGNKGVSEEKIALVNAAPVITPATVSNGPATLAASPAAQPNANVAIVDNNDDQEVLGESTQNVPKDEAKEVLAATTTPEVKGASDFAPFGLSWYWWLPILAAAAGAAWWLFAAWRRRQSEEA